ncbi:hypothetical protein KVT40_005273 [Elsinoe batatas]|uniref:Uncharacterized protein n=1 Tax=Elsinoe batatas TaxID=2601811 RepID=A0A8K0L170_9PEZI|nr:hypothetical protein KVT40_005273 [Elsinoe batatas]
MTRAALEDDHSANFFRQEHTNQQPVASWHLGRSTIGGACSACSHVYPLARYSPRLVLALPFLLHIYPTPTHDRALPQCTLLTILPVFLCPARLCT